MDATNAFSLLVLAVISLSFFVYVRTRSSSNANTPPGTSGWPIVGENINLGLSGPPKFIDTRMKKFSPDVFRTSLLGEKMAFFCGPQGNKFVFSNENKVLASWWPKSVIKVLLFTEVIDNNQKVVAPLLANVVHDILRPDALKRYVSMMDSMARKHMVTDWAPYEEVKVHPLSQKYTFALSCKLFMDEDDDDKVAKVLKNFNIVTNGMISLPIDFPGTAYNRAIKGGKLLRDSLLKIIASRRKELIENNEIVRQDILSQMLLMTSDDGRLLSEKEISNNIIGLLVASYETSSVAITFVLKHLAEHPRIYNEVRKEELLTWEDVEKMKYSWNVARESIRLAPPGQGAFREALTDFKFAGFTIPKGWKIFWNVNTTHNDPKYFPNPQKFDPSRFEGSGPAPYSFVPFGGGPRMCPGKEYARLEILIFMHNFVKNFKLEKLIPNEKILYRSTPVPAKGLPARLYPHGKN
ncbi:cytochrome P450 [Cynara cardunculus var. scolymus]|uniref:Cytochrome P450 n=1 Tax=Cynara cardunculus var. scolymus TaxID=59895 RepID=A0A103XLH6_CYNCS|nr:cytochrome P450 [Cynara cardunculus var. scolymus]